jgi:putative DNA primase/helicase
MRWQVPTIPCQQRAMTRTTLPTEIANEFWARTKIIDAAAPSEKLHAFRTCAEDLVRRFGRWLPRAELGDHLDELATNSGLLVKFGVDEIQNIISEAIDVAVSDEDKQDEEIKDGARPPEFSDEALALLFAEQHHDFLKYVALWNKWFVWKGTHWAADETLEVFHLVRRLCRMVAANCKEDKIAKPIASKKTVSAVFSLARADRRIAANTEQWDCHPLLLNTPSGVIDLLSGKQRPHDPRDYQTKITAVAPNPACTIPLWQAFLNRITGGDVEFAKFLQRVCGYALTGLTTEHALFFCYGTGSNGKSTFVNTVTGCIGDYHRSAPIETFTASKNERHPTELAGLRGARLVTAVETEEGRRWAESRIKSLTGGDKIAARFMRQDFFEFLPVFKLLIAGNHKPGLRSVDEAIRRRFYLLPFTRVIPKEERDLNFGDKLWEEWPGILAWMIDGCLDWQRQGLNPPAVVTAATAEYLEAEDSLAAWLDDAGNTDVNAFEYTNDLFASWKKYAVENGEYVGSMRKFSQRLEERGASIGLRKGRDSTGRRGFYGLRLRTAEPATANAAPTSDDDRVPM